MITYTNKHRSLDQIESDCRMVEVPVTCAVCNGKGQIRKTVDWSIYEEVVDCSNCQGEGEVLVERCNNCQQSEDECHCLDRVEVAEERLAEVA